MKNKPRHDFSEIIDRRASDSKKYDGRLYAKDVLPMWIADTDFRCPQPLVDAVTRRAEQGLYGYPLHDELFEGSLVHWLDTRFNCTIRREWVVFAPGVMPGIAYAIQGLTNPGDGVVIQTPIYPPFRDVLKNNGRQILLNPLELYEGRYTINFEGLEHTLAQENTRMLLLCNPHNPTGRVFSRMELACVAELCEKYGVYLVSDEIHCDVVFSHTTHTPLFNLKGAVEDFGIACYNPSKTFNIPGLRTAGLVIPNAKLKARVEKAIWAAKAYGRTVFGQLAFQTAYMNCAYYADEMLDYLEDNLKLVQQRLMPPIRLVKPDGTYLLWLDCRDLGMEDEALAAFFLQDCKLGLNAGVSFGQEGSGFMRMNIACPRPVLSDALSRIEAALMRRRPEFGEEDAPHDNA